MKRIMKFEIPKPCYNLNDSTGKNEALSVKQKPVCQTSKNPNQTKQKNTEHLKLETLKLKTP